MSLAFSNGKGYGIVTVTVVNCVVLLGNISDAKNGLIRLKYFINLEQELKKKLTIS